MTADPIYQQIGDVIRTRRKLLKFKQETLASQLGISRGSLANIETGRQSVLVHQLYRIAAALKLKPTDLLPPPTVSGAKAYETGLPLPNDLKAQQREQIARLMGEDEPDSTNAREARHGATPRR